MTRRRPKFIARDAYRLRRTIDAARLLPILGLLLFLLPVLWVGGATRGGFIYIFIVWMGLIVGAAVLSRRLKEPDNSAEDQISKGPDDGPV